MPRDDITETLRFLKGYYSTTEVARLMLRGTTGVRRIIRLMHYNGELSSRVVKRGCTLVTLYRYIDDDLVAD